MSKRDFLLEIGVEEMPARFVTDAMNQLETKITGWLEDKGISYQGSSAYSTPRRLAVLIQGLEEKQADVEEESRGPAKKIAVDGDNNWTKAALGFARGQGVSADDLFFKEVKGEEYVFAKKFTVGQETVALLPQIQELIKGLHFPKNMRWNNYDLRFVRPIHWLIALYGEELVPLEITTIQSNRYTYGHRFLGNKQLVNEPLQYVEVLRNQFVIVDPEERKHTIREQLSTMAKAKNWLVPVDEDLLEEVTNLVEYPTVLSGSYAPDFLVLPNEVLITSMREHQRYFPVKNQDDKLLPHFITVRNGNDQHLENVVRGNEKVLRARLADAQFFYNEDHKLKIDDALSQLENIVYHEELGSVGDKVRRIRESANRMADVLVSDEELRQYVDRASQLCKFDLVTQMVNEFPELQGRMGEEYALIAGEDEIVTKAINEHYMPRFSGDSSPSSEVGTVVSIADKLDTMTTCFAIGLIPTGSQDPYALRRQAAGIIQMILDQDLSVDLEQLLDISLGVVEQRQLLKRDRDVIFKELLEFFKLRIKNTLQERGVSYDVIDAVLLTAGVKRVDIVVKKAEFLMTKRNEQEFRSVVEALSRVTNIAKKAEDIQIAIRSDLFEQAEEGQLYAAYIEVEEVVVSAIEQGDVEGAYTALAKLQSPIHQYFDHIMVMAEQKEIKQNRLMLMKKISKLIRSFAHFNSIVFS